MDRPVRNPRPDESCCIAPTSLVGVSSSEAASLGRDTILEIEATLQYGPMQEDNGYSELSLLNGTVISVSSTPIPTPTAPNVVIDGASVGDPNAPVTIQVWADFMCPACQQWTSAVKPQLFEDFVKTGQVRLEFRQFPLQQHAPGAQMSAQASLCAADQNMFWPYHDRLFQAASTRGQAGVEIGQLTAYAREVGMDEARFTQGMNNQEKLQPISQELTQAQQLGLNNTPSILVNGQLIANPFDYNALGAQIDALAGK